MRLLPGGFMVTLTLSLLAMALAATAQPGGQVHRIGLLSTGRPPPWTIALAEAFRQGLRDLGSVEGQHILIEERWGMARKSGSAPWQSSWCSARSR